MSNLLQRWLTVLVVAPVLLLIIYGKTGPVTFTHLLIAVTALCGYELGLLVFGSDKFLIAWLATLSVLVLLALSHEIALSMLGLSVLMVIGLGVAVLKGSKALEIAPNMPWLLAGPWYLGTPFACMLLLHEKNLHWVIFALLVAWLGDTGGLYFGKAFGKHPMHPTASPQKTWEGSAGGVAASLIGMVLTRLFLIKDLPWLEGIAVAVVASLAGQLGDLTESLIKRASGAKDSGGILPGHGGLLDRVDAVLFAAPVVWAYVEYIS